MSKKNNLNSVIWVLDECVCQDKERWSVPDGHSVTSATDLSLLGTKDDIISEKLKDLYPNKNIIIITKNIHIDKNGDYFRLSNNLGIVRFSSSIASGEDQKKYFEKFQRSFRNTNKLVGAAISLSKTNIYYKKRSKSKILKYNNYI